MSPSLAPGLMVPPPPKTQSAPMPCHALGGAASLPFEGHRRPAAIPLLFTLSSLGLVVVVGDLSVASESALAPGKKRRVLTLAVRDWTYLGIQLKRPDSKICAIRTSLLALGSGGGGCSQWLSFIHALAKSTQTGFCFSAHSDRRARALIRTTTGSNLHTGVHLSPRALHAVLMPLALTD